MTLGRRDSRPAANGVASATLGGGCFWCLEAVFQELEGIVGIKSGYAGGHSTSPTYEEVSTGVTGHAEVVRLEYDPQLISYEELLKVFFAIHDPTTRDRQGNDVGTQYRSIILYEGEEQRRVAEAVMVDITEQALYSDPLVTELVELGTFYPSEEYHDDYFTRNPQVPYCQFVVAPKVAKFRSEFIGRLKGA